ncbi:hypothetical protein RRG08_015392 [Elysia crispata]|uniref:Uncharacterized protein n=1 Tax=Elysia crispata TaxID=231223 RepID=A0AAE1E4X8_9GAST|nr:hypothetical protein RRG08_015392 [Elysia crispata]
MLLPPSSSICALVISCRGLFNCQACLNNLSWFSYTSPSQKQFYLSADSYIACRSRERFGGEISGRLGCALHSQHLHVRSSGRCGTLDTGAVGIFFHPQGRGVTLYTKSSIVLAPSLPAEIRYQ